MQPTKETIGKIFAMYLGCDIAHNDKEIAKLIGIVEHQAHFIHSNTGSYGVCDVSNAGKLLLTPLHAITDERAIGLSAILFPDKEFSTREQTIGYVKNALSYHIRGNGWLGDKYDTGEARFLIKFIKFTNITKAREALQLIDYDLPMLVLGGKTPIEAGIAIDRTTQTKSPATGNSVAE